MGFDNITLINDISASKRRSIPKAKYAANRHLLKYLHSQSCIAYVTHQMWNRSQKVTNKTKLIFVQILYVYLFSMKFYQTDLNWNGAYCYQSCVDARSEYRAIKLTCSRYMKLIIVRWAVHALSYFTPWRDWIWINTILLVASWL